MKKINKKKGFTLIELLAVIAILAVVSLIAVPIVTNLIVKAKNKAYYLIERNMIQAVQKGVSQDNDIVKEIFALKDGDSTFITLQSLIDEDYMKEVIDPNKKTKCDFKVSGIYAKKVAGYDDIQYVAYLVCPGYKTDLNVDIMEDNPNIVLKGKTQMDVIKNSTFVDPGYEIDSSISYALSVKINGKVDTSKIGTYTLEYTLMYDEEVLYSIKRRVNVIEDVDAPIIKFKDGVSKPIKLNVGDEFDVYDYIEITDNANTFEELDIEIDDSEVDTRVVGDYLVKVSATDKSNNKAEFSFRIVVGEYVKKPIISQNDLVNNCYVEGQTSVTITYESAYDIYKKLYKIDNGEWLEYKVPIEIDTDSNIDKVYAKTVLEDGRESSVVSKSFRNILPEGYIAICSYEDLNNVRNNLTAKYMLMTDITMTTNWTPIPNFAGTFDGNNYTISNMTISGSSNVGLFGSTTGSNVTIKNIVLENVSISGTYRVGGLIGYNNSTTSVIENVAITGSVKGTSSYTGGLIGFNSGAIVRNS